MPLSEKQMTYLALAWQCFESEPKIDYDRFSKVAGLASANSARELMRVTKKKLKEEYGALARGVQTANAKTVNCTPKSTPKKANGTKSASGTPAPGSTTGKKRAKSDLDGHAADENDEEGEESPTKKTRKGGSPVKKVFTAADDDGDEWS